MAHAAPVEDRLIGTAEAAEILGWPQRRVQRHATTGAIPIVGKINHGQHLVFRESEIEEIAEKEKTPELN